MTDIRAAVYVARSEDLLYTLLTEHVDDGRGRCPACPGAAGGRPVWPCPVRGVADAALALRRAREQRGLLDDHAASPAR